MPIQSFAERALDAQKQLTDWQIGQMKLVEKHLSASLELARTGYTASAQATLDGGRSVVAALFPAEPAA